MEIYNFGPLLGKVSVDKELCDELYKIGKEKTKDFSKGLAGKIEKELSYDTNDLIYFQKKLQPYINQYVTEIGKIRKSSIGDFDILLDHLWINFQKPTEYNPPHIHTSLLSFVIYLDVSNEIKKEVSRGTSSKNGSITFKFGNRTVPMDLFTDIDRNFIEFFQPIVRHSFVPDVGDMMVFPAYLEHFVQAFYSTNSIRVSVSGNIRLNPKNLDKKGLI